MCGCGTIALANSPLGRCLFMIRDLESKLEKIQGRLDQAETTYDRWKLNEAQTKLSNELESWGQVKKVLEAGYQETFPPDKIWYVWGEVGTDPRPFRNHFLWRNLLPFLGWFILWRAIETFATSFLPVTLGPAIIIFQFAVLPLAIACFSVGYLFIIFFYIGYLDKVGLKSLRDHGYSESRESYFLRTIPPPEVQKKIDQAKASGLFAEILVYAPEETFTKTGRGPHLVCGWVEGSLSHMKFKIAEYAR